MAAAGWGLAEWARAEAAAQHTCALPQHRPKGRQLHAGTTAHSTLIGEGPGEKRATRTQRMLWLKVAKRTGKLVAGERSRRCPADAKPEQNQGPSGTIQHMGVGKRCIRVAQRMANSGCRINQVLAGTDLTEYCTLCSSPGASERVLPLVVGKHSQPKSGVGDQLDRISPPWNNSKRYLLLGEWGHVPAP